MAVLRFLARPRQRHSGEFVVPVDTTGGHSASMPAHPIRQIDSDEVGRSHPRNLRMRNGTGPERDRNVAAPDVPLSVRDATIFAAARAAVGDSPRP
jgi:hypothetical protein